MKWIALPLVVLAMLAGCADEPQQVEMPAEPAREYVQVSTRDPRYFELEDGTPFIPIGLNVIHPNNFDAEGGLQDIESWMRALSENGGNFMRVWLSNEYWNVEQRAMGEYDEEMAKRIDRLFELAKKYDIRLKLTFEHFRTLDGDGWASKSIYKEENGGCASDMTDFFTSADCRRHFTDKLDWYKDRYGDDPIVFAWELWNEINAVDGDGWMDWTRDMLPEVHARFPRSMAIQSLGSFDRDSAREAYREYVGIPSNDIAQVHRYLDLGAPFEVCHGPADVLAADAVTELISYEPGKPVLLAESGAVEPNHAGPFELYDVDHVGLILHDVLFAPFFSGAAGSGQIWHWNVYVAENDLWWQFARFAEAVRGLDPAAEHFQPVRIEHPFMRIYGLKGEHTFVAWCRDGGDTWQHELRDGRVQEIIRGTSIDLSQAGLQFENAQVDFYDPWADRHYVAQLNGSVLALPVFSRSVVVRLEY